MIEHDMDTALDMAERITLLHYGTVIVEGSRAEVVAHRRRARSTLATEALGPVRDQRALAATATCCSDVSFRWTPRVLALLGRNGRRQDECMSAIRLRATKDGEIRLVRGGDRAAFPGRRSARARRGPGGRRAAASFRR